MISTDLSRALQTENIPASAIARVSKHLKMEGYLAKGENYRIGLDTTHHFGSRLTTVYGDAITPDRLDRIVSIVARDLANPEETRTLRLPSTLFCDATNRAVFICDNQLIELTLAQQTSPNPRWNTEFKQALFQLMKETNAAGRRGYGSDEYENLNDIPPNVRHVGCRVLSPQACLYDCIARQWREISPEDLQLLNTHYQKVKLLREDIDVIDPESYERNLDQLWYVPEWFSKNKYEFLILVVDNGMLILSGQPKEITETKKPFFFVRTGPSLTEEIDQSALRLSFIKDKFCNDVFGEVDPDKDVMLLHTKIR